MDALRRTCVCGMALIGSLSGIAPAIEPKDPLKTALAGTTSIQMELAMAQKRLSIPCGATRKPNALRRGPENR
jgi:hypothetical protein